MTSSDVQQTRQALGARLRELRRSAGFNGKQFAGRLGCDPAKVSRIERGQQTPTEADIKAWSLVAGKPEIAAELAGHLRALETFYAAWPRQLRVGLQIRQQGILNSEARTMVLRVFECSVLRGI